MAAKGDDFSITDVNKRYIQNDKVELRILNDEIWLDCGTPDNLLEAGKLASAGVLSPSPCNIRPGEKNIE
jgi:dTDP-glucose pyrophosphorylase